MIKNRKPDCFISLCSSGDTRLEVPGNPSRAHRGTSSTGGRVARDIEDSSSPGPRPGRSRDLGSRTGPVDREIDELAAAEEAFPEIVSLAFGHDQADGVPGAGGLVAGGEGGGVLFQGDELVMVAVDE